MVGENNFGADIEKSDGAKTGKEGNDGAIKSESVIDNPKSFKTWQDTQNPKKGANGADTGRGLPAGNGLPRIHEIGAREKSKDEILAETTKSPETLAKLAKSDKLLVRMSVAKNSFTEPKVYEELTNDKNPLVRQAAAHTFRPMSEDQQMKFTEDKDSDVRYAIAARKDVTEKVLDKLSGDKEWVVRDRVASSANTSPTRLAQMLNDPVPLVAKSAMNNPHTPKEAIVAAQKAAAEKAAWKPKDDYKSLAELKQDVMRNGSLEMQQALKSFEEASPNAQVLQALVDRAAESMAPEARQYVQALRNLLNLDKKK